MGKRIPTVNGTVSVEELGIISMHEHIKQYIEEKFYRMWLDEVEHGIGNSRVFPGVIKVGTGNTVPNLYETRILKAAGMLQKDTGLPVCVHSVTGCRNQQDILEQAGADLSRVYFSHVEAEFGWEARSLEQQFDNLESVVKKGSYLSYNNFGNWAQGTLG